MLRCSSTTAGVCAILAVSTFARAGEFCFRGIATNDDVDRVSCFGQVSEPEALPGVNWLPDESCTFLFWWIDGQIYTQQELEPFPEFETADAWYFCRRLGDRPDKDVPPSPGPFVAQAFDIACGQFILAPSSNLHVESTNPTAFERSCTTTPCSILKGIGADVLQTVTAWSSLRVVDDCLQQTSCQAGQRRFSHWLVDGAQQTDPVVRIASPYSMTFAVAFFKKTEDNLCIHTRFDSGDLVPVGVSRLCAQISGSGLDGCPCGFGDLCEFAFFDVEGIDIEMYSSRKAGWGVKAVDAGSHMKVITLNPEMLKKAGGLEHLGLRLTPKPGLSLKGGAVRMVVRGHRIDPKEQPSRPGER